ncbi:lipopolysaccharide biosynthesis protein [Derxia gummosa]|uniref:Lipopolysaccharide biosynthesis protein n=1 Tax=Derxia gummosa DSM 723 TaxID=1121388 RepID=A0A8B6XCU1_9BURK|nr:lipopolysaccharide biosynthesis protein [Derxia gummosa]
MITKKTLVSGMFWSAVRVWGTRVTTLVVFMVLARLLAPDAIGTVALVTTYTQIIWTLLSAGLAEYLIQAKTRDPHREAAAFWVQVGAATLIAALLVVFREPAAALLLADAPDRVPLLLVMAALIPLQSMPQVAEGVLRRELAFKALAMRSTVIAFAGGATGVGLALAGWGVWSLMAKLVVEAVLDVVVVFWSARWHPFRSWSLAALAPARGFVAAMFGTRVVELIQSRSDALIVQAFLGTAALGYYSTGLRLFQICYELLGGMTWQVSVPFLSRLKEQPEEFRRVALRLGAVLSLVAIPGFGLLAIVAPDIVPVVFGEKWRAAAPVLAIYALAGLPFGAVHFLQVAPIALGRSASYFHITAVTAACVVAGAFAGVRYGLEAVALSGVLAEVVQVALVLRNSRGLLGIGPAAVLRSQRVPMLVGGLALAAAALALWAAQSAGTSLRLAAAFGSFGVVYALALLTLSPEAIGFLRELRGGVSSSRAQAPESGA